MQHLCTELYLINSFGRVEQISSNQLIKENGYVLYTIDKTYLCDPFMAICLLVVLALCVNLNEKEKRYMTTKKLEIVQVMRAFACISIFLYHLPNAWGGGKK